MENEKKTEAYVIDQFDNVVGIIDTHIKSGAIKYGWQKTIDGSPVNLRSGKLSRAKKYAKRAAEVGFDRDLYIVG